MEAAKQGDLTDKNGSNEQCIEIEIPFDLFQYLSSNDCNIQNICRLCLSPKNIIMYPLLTSKDDNVLSEMLKAFTNIEVHQEESIPYLVCESCHNQVIQCYEFKLKCEKSDFTLKSILKGEFVIKTEEEIVKSPNTPVTKEPLNEIDIKQETHIPIKVEPDPEDTQYFDADMTSDNYATNVIEDTAKRKRKTKLLTNAGKMPIVIDSNDHRKLKSQKRTQKNLQCTFCSKIFLKVKTLQSHIKTKHKDVKLPFGCGQCKESFNSEHDLMVHSAVHTKGSTWSCNQCQKVFSGKRPLRRHIQRHMESKRYACEACGKTFVELYALRRHSRVHTGEVVEKKHACDYCDKRYSESCLLAAHVEGAHRGSRPCACECGKRFASPRLLASHRRLHDDRKPYACRYCDKRFRHESTRNTHHRTHTGEKPYVCSFCGKTFIQNSNLTLHLRTHTGERPYSCKKCERKFSSGSSLKAHERIHTGERPYSCPVCGKRFARMNMKTHMRLHSNERPHRCGACPKAYVTAYRLREHAKIHTDERPFECVSCLKNFSSRSHLMKHIKAHQLAKRTAQPQETVIVRRIQDDKQNDNEIVVESISDAHDVSDKGIILEESEVPLDVSEELVLQDRSNVLVVGSSTEVNYERGDICLNSSGVNFPNNDYSNDVNLVTVNEGGLSISSAGGGLEATTMKLYQVDQSLVQIHSSGGQVTISKITSKMTANF